MNRNMRRSLLQIALAFFIFSIGIIAGARWQTQPSHSRERSAVVQAVEEKQWPLSQELVSRTLQTHSFRTDKLRRNSNDEIVWRWLKESIAAYPQNWVKLNISAQETYEVVLYPQKTLSSVGLTYRNKKLSEKRRPLLREGKRYLPIQVYQGNSICPSWLGLVDVEEAKLVYFAGDSG
jgi:hypothetical protein